MQTLPDAGCEEWRNLTDRREKKRAQNRVAQRSYRKRVKQRLEDLQAQVDEKHAKLTQINQADPSAGSNGATSSSGSAAIPPLEAAQSNGTAAAATVEWLDGSASAEVPRNRLVHPFFWGALDAVLPPDLDNTTSASDNGGTDLTLENIGDSIAGYSASDSIRRAATSRSSRSGDAITPPPLLAADALASKIAISGSYPLANSDEYEHSAKIGTAPLSPSLTAMWPLTVASSSVSTPPELDAAAPLEKRLEHLVNITKRLGFKNFDALATAYYTSPLDPNGPVRLEQRLSRNRWLPALLAEIRQRSTEWSAWERRAYEEEILRSAEEICREEWHDELGKDAERWRYHRPNEAAVQDRLPHLWTFLTGLSANNTLVPPQHHQHAVVASILLLSGHFPAAKADLPECSVGPQIEIEGRYILNCHIHGYIDELTLVEILGVV